MSLSRSQETALRLCTAGHNVMVTGPGGTGKTHLIRTVVERMKAAGKQVQVCALTGCAAVLLECDAKTIHSWSGVGLANADIGTVVERVCTNKYKSKAWKGTDLLIVDEVSMMSKKLFDILDAVGRAVLKQPFKPFGGLQLMFSGDFYQLPPVGTRDEPETTAFCFESREWTRTFPAIVSLKTMYRQTDPTYVKVLNQVRRGRLSKRSFALLSERVIEPPADSVLQVTQLVPRRSDAERINEAAMRALPTEGVRYTLGPAKEVPDWSRDKDRPARVSAAAASTEMEYLATSVMAHKSLELKVGAQVMCVANVSMSGPHPIVNGSRGVVKEFVDGLPVIDFGNGCITKIGKHVWPSESLPGVGIEQIPLILAWAITIHKAQGVTLDAARVNAGGGVFECGQTYVALSRIRSMEGLYLTAIDPGKIKINVKVQAFYDSLAAQASAPRLPLAPDPPSTRPEELTTAQRPRSRVWTKEDDQRLWDSRDDRAGLCVLEGKLGRAAGAISARLKHLRNSRHKAFTRLHGPAAADQAQNASRVAAKTALAAARVARQMALDASGCHISAWAEKLSLDA